MRIVSETRPGLPCHPHWDKEASLFPSLSTFDPQRSGCDGLDEIKQQELEREIYLYNRLHVFWPQLCTLRPEGGVDGWMY